ncbi:MAG: ABC-F family ATP-binding cassette domain-containing protein [Lachnospiraceae bacterium]|nr:ABC-F family ATP-binding cassette domain-containing protein [Lachnospiraceae bacterium]
MILTCNNISKAYGTDEILRDVSFVLNEREKMAVVGINGAGKSTLLKIIAGELSADSGSVIKGKDVTIGYLSQQQGLTSGNTIRDEVMSVKADVFALERNMRRCEEEMKNVHGEELERMLSTYNRLTHEFEMKNGYAIRSEINGVLNGLGFGNCRVEGSLDDGTDSDDFSAIVDTLSGGQKTRVALSKLLLSQPDIIMLDEPTNHLDMRSVEWLESFLANYKGAVIIVAHDRYFLDRIATKVLEIENGKGRVYTGNFSAYSEKKKAVRADELKAYLNQQKDIEHQEKVIATLKSYNREKSIKRAESREKMLAKTERLERPTELDDKMNLRFRPCSESGNDVLDVKGLSKSFDGNELFKNVDFLVKRGDRVGIIGDNGTGKTTLLKIICRKLAPDTGTIRLGTNVKIGYYDQEHHVLDPDNTIFEEISDTYPDMDNTRIRNLLAAFLFKGDDAFKLIRDISGGEKARVSLAKLMLSDANLLILDEPTNHLDIVSKELLEEAVSGYGGTVIFVSHDRYFINKTATRIMEITADGVTGFEGNYEYYVEKRDEVIAAMRASGAYTTNCAGTAKTQNTTASAGPATQVSSGRSEWEEKKRLTGERRKLENDIAKCEDEIKRLEERNEEIDRLFEDAEIATSPSKLSELTGEKEANEEKIMTLMESWEELNERLDINNSAML